MSSSARNGLLPAASFSIRLAATEGGAVPFTFGTKSVPKKLKLDCTLAHQLIFNVQERLLAHVLDNLPPVLGLFLKTCAWNPARNMF